VTSHLIWGDGRQVSLWLPLQSLYPPLLARERDGEGQGGRQGEREREGGRERGREREKEISRAYISLRAPSRACICPQQSMH